MAATRQSHTPLPQPTRAESERSPRPNEQRRENEKRLQREKRYFIEKMSLDDCERFEQLDSLYRSTNHIEEADAYAHGFAVGALLMLEVMEQKEGLL